MARVLVRRSAKTTSDGPALVRLLAEKIPSERDANAFAAAALEKVFGSREPKRPRTGLADLSNKPVEAVDVDKATGQLAPYVGRSPR